LSIEFPIWLQRGEGQQEEKESKQAKEGRESKGKQGSSKEDLDQAHLFQGLA